jgi:hypothetical protein
VIFPLTPRRVLVMDDRHEQLANQHYPVKLGSVGPLNLLIWRNGRLLLTGRPVPEVLSELVAGLPEETDGRFRRSAVARQGDSSVGVAPTYSECAACCSRCWWGNSPLMRVRSRTRFRSAHVPGWCGAGSTVSGPWAGLVARLPPRVDEPRQGWLGSSRKRLLNSRGDRT